MCVDTSRKREQALHARPDLRQLVHHSDRGVQRGFKRSSQQHSIKWIQGPRSALQAAGREVESVVAEVLFYSVETEGALSNVLVAFADGAQFSFGCAGDGTVSVTRSRGAVGNAPGYSTVPRTITGLTGTMEAAEPHGNRLRMVVGGHTVVFVNLDDELSVTVDGECLPSGTFKR